MTLAAVRTVVTTMALLENGIDAQDAAFSSENLLQNPCHSLTSMIALLENPSVSIECQDYKLLRNKKSHTAKDEDSLSLTTIEKVFAQEFVSEGKHALSALRGGLV